MPSTAATLRLIGRPIAYYPALNQYTGGVTATLMLCQLIYWSARTDDADGWFYKTQAQMTAETGLSRHETEHARKQLRSAGLIAERRAGLPARMYYRVCDDVLDALIAEAQVIEAPDLIATKRQASLPLSGKLECQKPADSLIYTETTAQSTAENTSTRERVRTPRDDVFDAVVRFCDTPPGTKSELARVGAAVKELCGWAAGVGMSLDMLASEIDTRGARYRRRSPHLPATAHALASNWSSLATEQRSAQRAGYTPRQLMAMSRGEDPTTVVEPRRYTAHELAEMARTSRAQREAETRREAEHDV